MMTTTDTDATNRRQQIASMRDLLVIASRSCDRAVAAFHRACDSDECESLYDRAFARMDAAFRRHSIIRKQLHSAEQAWAAEWA